MAEPLVTQAARYQCCYCELPIGFRHGAEAPPYWEHVETGEPQCVTSEAPLALPRGPLVRVKRLLGPSGNGPSTPSLHRPTSGGGT